MFSGKDYSLYDGIPKEFRAIRNKEFNDWEIPPWELVLDPDIILGEGKFGKVYLGEWRKTKVAAKIINDSVKLGYKDYYIKEFDTMSKTHHPNIVQLLGYVENPFIIVMEYLSNGNLLDYTNKNKLTVTKKIEISMNILRGLNYLHNRKPNIIIHRDIKTKNVLISPSGFAKIGDFGLSKVVSDNNIKQIPSLQDLVSENNDQIESGSNVVGTYKYMAPELKNCDNYTYKIDIWSVGIIFAELFENKDYDDKFYWSKTPNEIRDIIISHMLRDDDKNRFDSSELISLFEQIQNKKRKFCICL